LRQIGTLPKELDPSVFSDFLLTLGMKSRVDEHPDAWILWIYNEDHLARARAELQSYLAGPDDPRYHSAAQAAQAIRHQEHQLEAKFRKNFRVVSDQWAYPGLRRRPLTSALVAASLAIFVLLQSASHSAALEEKLRFSTLRAGLGGQPRNNGFDDILHGEVWRLITPIFLHFHILHIFFNMMALSALGTMIEMRRGTLRLAGLVLLSAVASNVGQYLYMEKADPGTPDLFGGMSGVVFALFGYVWMKGLHEPAQGMILHPNSVAFMLFWLALCMTGALGPIANAAHVVGLVVGVAFGVFRY
jgi:GlpG protein